MSLAWESASPVPCLSLWERWPSAARTERANKEGPPPGGPSFSLSINLSCHSEEHPKGTCFAARSDVGIRNLLVANSQKNAKIVRFGNRLPRQSADWLAMTGFFDSLCQREALTVGLSFRGRGRAPPLHTPTAPALCPYPVIPSQCSHWRGNPHPAPAGAELPRGGLSKGTFRACGRGVLLPTAAKVPKNAVQTCGLKIPARLHTVRISTTFPTRTLCHANFP